MSQALMNRISAQCSYTTDPRSPSPLLPSESAEKKNSFMNQDMFPNHIPNPTAFGSWTLLTLELREINFRCLTQSMVFCYTVGFRRNNRKKSTQNTWRRSINVIKLHLARLLRKKEKIQIMNFRNKQNDIIIDSTDTKNITRYYNFYVSKHGNLDKINKFLLK